MENLKALNHNHSSVPYKPLFLLTLCASVITVNLGELNLAIGDIFLFILNIMLILSLKNDLKIESNRKKWVLTVLSLFTVILFLSYVSIHSYIDTGYSVSRGVIELIKLTVAVNYGIVFSLYFAYSNEKDRQSFLKFMIVAGVIVALTGILGTILYNIGINNPFVMNGQRAKGTLSDTNIMAIFIVTILPLIFLVHTRIKSIMLFLLFAVSVLATSSKAAIVVSLLLLGVFLTMLIFTNKLNKFFNHLFITLIVLFTVYTAINSFSVFSLLSDRLSELASSDPSVITTGRTDLWVIGLSLMRDPKYLLMGIGYGSFANYMVNVNVPYYLTDIKLVHNTYISMFVETGLMTFIILSLLSVYLLTKTFLLALISKDLKWILILISQLSLIIGMNQVNLQNNRYVYFLFVYYFFVISRNNFESVS